MEPERPIEQKLRAYGASRRAGAGEASLHPATRRLLQGEVVRAYGAARSPAPSGRVWPRVAWSSAILGALIVLLLTLIPEKEAPIAPASVSAAKVLNQINPGTSGELALAKDGQRALGATATAIPPAASAPGLVRLADDAVSRNGPAEPAREEAAPAAIAYFFARTDANGGPMLTAPETSPPAPAIDAAARRLAPEMARTGAARETFMANQGYVRQAAPLNDERVTAADKLPLLSNFRVLQINDSFEVIDADGSVYKGRLETVEDTKRTQDKFDSETRAGAFSMTPAPAEQTLLFRVAGTNQSLGQYVFISGRFVPQAAAKPAPATSSLGLSNEQTHLSLQLNHAFSNQAALTLSNQLQLAPLLQKLPDRRQTARRPGTRHRNSRRASKLAAKLSSSFAVAHGQLLHLKVQVLHQQPQSQ